MAEIEELRKQIAKLAREIEELKRRKELVSKGLSIHDPLGVSRALEEALKDKRDGSLFVHAGLMKKNGVIVDSWNQSFTLEQVLEVAPEKIVRFISPLTNENRIRILKLLLKGPKSVSEISKAVGLKGGELYHHLKELIHSGYIRVVSRGIYSLTMKGEIALIMISGMAHWLEPMTKEEIEHIFKEITK